jgi:hypothetical protein
MFAFDKTLVDGVIRMILSHAVHDEAAFVKGAESVNQEFVATNHAREAPQLREGLRAVPKTSSNSLIRPLNRLCFTRSPFTAFVIPPEAATKHRLCNLSSKSPDC